MGMGCVMSLAMGIATLGVDPAHGDTIAFWWSAALPAAGEILAWVSSRAEALRTLPTTSP